VYLRRPGHLLAHLVQRENQPVANLSAVWPLDPQTVCGVPVRADAMLLHCTSRPRCFSSPGGRRRTWMVSLLAVMSTPTNTGRSRSWPLLPWGRQRTCGSRFRTRCRFGLVTCPSSRTVRLEREALAAAFRTAGPDAATLQSSDRAGNRVDAHPVVLHLAQGTWGVATAAGCRRRPRMSRTPLAWVEKARIGRHTTTGIERRRLIARHRSQVPLLTREGSTR